MGIPKHEKHLRLPSSGTKLFITFEFKGFSTQGREIHNLSMMTFSSAPPPSRAAPVACKFVWPLRAPKVDPSRSESSSQLKDFFKIPQILRAHFRCMTSFTSTGQPFYLGFLFWYLWTTHPLCTRVNTCAQVFTKLNHVLSRKVLSLTKPKGKIYKTKSLGHYITITLIVKITEASRKYAQVNRFNNAFQ